MGVVVRTQQEDSSEFWNDVNNYIGGEVGSSDRSGFKPSGLLSLAAGMDWWNKLSTQRCQVRARWADRRTSSWSLKEAVEAIKAEELSPTPLVSLPTDIKIMADSPVDLNNNDDFSNNNVTPAVLDTVSSATGTEPSVKGSSLPTTPDVSTRATTVPRRALFPTTPQAQVSTHTTPGTHTLSAPLQSTALATGNAPIATLTPPVGSQAQTRPSSEVSASPTAAGTPSLALPHSHVARDKTHRRHASKKADEIACAQCNQLPRKHEDSTMWGCDLCGDWVMQSCINQADQDTCINFWACDNCKTGAKNMRNFPTLVASIQQLREDWKKTQTHINTTVNTLTALYGKSSPEHMQKIAEEEKKTQALKHQASRDLIEAQQIQAKTISQQQLLKGTVAKLERDLKFAKEKHTSTEKSIQEMKNSYVAQTKKQEEKFCHELEETNRNFTLHKTKWQTENDELRQEVLELKTKLHTKENTSTPASRTESTTLQTRPTTTVFDRLSPAHDLPSLDYPQTQDLLLHQITTSDSEASGNATPPVTPAPHRKRKLPSPPVNLDSDQDTQDYDITTTKSPSRAADNSDTNSEKSCSLLAPPSPPKISPPTKPLTKTFSTKENSITSKVVLPSSPKKLKPHTKVAVVTDSLLQELAVNPELNAAAYRQDWSMAMLRGGDSTSLKHLLRRIEITDYTHMIISMGSNDINCMLNQRLARSIILDDVSDAYKATLKKTHKQGINVAILLPPPRKDSSNAHMKQVHSVIRSAAIEYPHVTCVPLPASNESPEQFVAKRLKSDAIHFTHTTAVDALHKLANALTIPTLDMQGTIHPSEYAPNNICFKCGVYHRTNLGKRFCNTKVYCDLCNTRDHNSRVCPSLANMCTTCGARKHTRNTCPHSKRF